MQFCRFSCRLITSACDLFCFPVAGRLFQFLLTLSDPTAALDHSYCVSGPMGLGTPPLTAQGSLYGDTAGTRPGVGQILCLRLHLA